MKAIKELQKEAHETAKEKGFHENWNFGTAIALIHSEATEALEAYRNGRPNSYVAEELADIVIRTMDLAHYLNIDLSKEIIMKMKINKQRPHKHGGKEF